MISSAILVSTLAVVLDAAAPAPDGGAPATDGGDAAVDDCVTAADGSAPLTADAPVAVVDAAAVLPPPPAVPRGRIQGQVLAKGVRRQPIVGATISLGVDASVETDAAGRFSVELPCGRRKAIFQAPEFDPMSIEVDACAREDVTVRLMPSATGARPYETVVQAGSVQRETRLQAEELTRTAGSLGDPLRVIESLPGVSTVQWPAPLYVVRGSNPGNTGYFIDDVRIPALFHVALGPAVIHPYLFDKLDFYAGGYPAHYGRYVAGIVASRTREPPGDAVHGAVDVRLFDAGALLSAPLPGGNGSVTAAARYSYTGALVSALNGTYKLSYWDYQLRVRRRLGALRLSLFVFGSDDYLATGFGDTNELTLRFHRASLAAELPVGEGRLVGRVTVGVDRTRAPFMSSFPMTVKATSVAPRLAYRRDGRRADVEIGFDGELMHYDPLLGITRPGAIDLTQARSARLLAGYASLTVRPARGIVVTPELRLDTYAVGGTEKMDLGPRIAARADVARDTWIKVAGGRFSQTPSLPLLLPGVESFGLGVYGLQTSWQGSIGIGSTRLLGLETELTGFVQRYVLTDVRAPAVHNIDPLAPDFLVRRDAMSYGIEVLVRRPVGHRLHGWLSYTLANSLRAFDNGVVASSDWDQRHVLNLVLGYRFGRYTAGGRAHLNTGRPVPLVNGDGYRRLPAYYQLDLRIDRRFVFDHFALEAYAEIQNATLSRQVLSLDYDSGAVKENTVLIVLPSIGVHAEF